MDAANRKPKVERLGWWWGRLWHGYVRGERRVAIALKHWGIPANVTAVLVWAMRLALLTGLAYAIFWPTLLVIGAIVVAWAAQLIEPDERREPEWRHGSTGYGLYTSNEYRVDPHDPEDEQD